MKKAYSGAREKLAAADQVCIANTLIHTALVPKAKGRKDGVQRSMRLMRQLIEEDGFVPDRVTINILLKGLLGWVKQIDVNTVRALFDRVVSSGYPTGGLYAADASPFSAQMTVKPAMVDLEHVQSPISFVKHVRPLYKMFIRALEQRKDFEGARVVDKILRTVQKQHHAELAEKEAAMAAGTVQKWERQRRRKKEGEKTGQK